MDLDRTVHLYFDWTGASPDGGPVAEHFGGGGFEDLAERREVRFFRDLVGPAREVYAKFAGCDSVNGNDAILSSLYDVLSRGRGTMFMATEGNYLLSGTDDKPFIDHSAQAMTIPSRDLERVDLDGDDLTSAVGHARFAIHRLGTPEGTDYVAIAADGRSHSWSGDWVEGKDTVEMLRSLEAAGALPAEARDLMTDEAREVLDADSPDREKGWVPGP